MTRLFSIRLRRDFLSAAASNQKFVTGSFVVQFRLREAAHPVAPETIRFGYTVTKKMGNAVARNRIKRRLREAVRAGALEKAQPGHDYVIISRHKALDCSFSDLVRDMEFAFSRIAAKKKPASNQ